MKALLCAALLAARPALAQLRDITINYPAKAPANWPIFLAKEGGYYQKYGLNAKLVFAVHPAGIAMLPTEVLEWTVNGRRVAAHGNRADFDGWAADGAAGWSYDEVLPYFKRSEDNERGEDAYHGVGGPMRVSESRAMTPLVDLMVEAARNAGHEHNPDLNGARQEGVGRWQLTQRGGMRESTADAFLRPAMDRPNLDVITRAMATRVLFDAARATALALAACGNAPDAKSAGGPLPPYTYAPEDASLELHAHLFMKQVMSFLVHGGFDEPLKAQDWTSLFGSQANADAVGRSGIGLLVVALYAHPLLARSRRAAVREQIALTERFVAEHPDWALAKSPAEARAARASGRRAGFTSGCCKSTSPSSFRPDCASLN